MVRWAALLLIVALTSPGLVRGEQDPDARLPLPEPAAQQQSEKLIRDLFKDRYAKRADADRIALARELLKQGLETKDDLASRYVLLREARTVASEARDVTTAFLAIEEMAKQFQVQPVTLKEETLAAAAKSARTPDVFESLAKANLELADEALDRELLESADKAAQAAEGLAKKAKSVSLTTQASAKVKEVSGRKKDFEEVRKAREKIASAPDDPASNLVLGIYECAVKENWPAGLSMLANGSDATVKAAAEMDLKTPSAAAEQMAVGDAWWSVAETAKGASQNAFRGRAAYWYRKALPTQSGLSKTKMEKRIADAPALNFKEEAPPPAPDRPDAAATSAAYALKKPKTVDLLRLVDVKQDALSEGWNTVNGTVVCKGTYMRWTKLQIANYPKLPAEYDLNLVVERQERTTEFTITLPGYLGKQFAVSFDVSSGSFSGITAINGKNVPGGPAKVPGGFFLKEKTARAITIMVRKDVVIVVADGKDFLTWKADWPTVSLPDRYALQDGGLVGFTMHHYGIYGISKATVSYVP